MEELDFKKRQLSIFHLKLNIDKFIKIEITKLKAECTEN